MRTTAIVCFLTLFALAVVPVPASSAREIVVEVTSIAASMRPAEERAEKPAKLDPRLAPISRNLRTLFAYDKYTFLNSDRAEVALGRSQAFRLPEHFGIEVVPERFGRNGADMIKMKVTLFREGARKKGKREDGAPEREVVLRTEIRLKNGGTVLLGGPPIRAGVLVLALSAKG